MSVIEVNRANAGEDEAAEPADADLLITHTMAERPGALWTAPQIVRATGLSMADALVGLARLVAAGQIERVAPGRYRHPTQSPDRLVVRVRLDVLGLAE